MALNTVYTRFTERLLSDVPDNSSNIAVFDAPDFEIGTNIIFISKKGFNRHLNLVGVGGERECHQGGRHEEEAGEAGESHCVISVSGS